ncbi:MAG: hypothetical protein QOD10_934 [Mycobacterium sp.]|nr:hypothetical protein [Mycobacterium sp.]
MTKRVILAALAIPAMLITAAPAHAAGLSVNFLPKPDGISVDIRETSGVQAKQDCTYDATAQLPSLLPPVHRDFVLGVQGEVSWEMPGIPTLTRWNVVVNCVFSSPAPANAQPGSFSQVVTY